MNTEKRKKKNSDDQTQIDFIFSYISITSLTPVLGLL